jgi:hypothetical protein
MPLLSVALRSREIHKNGDIGCEPGKIRDALLTTPFHLPVPLNLILTCDKHVTALTCFVRKGSVEQEAPCSYLSLYSFLKVP